MSRIERKLEESKARQDKLQLKIKTRKKGRTAKAMGISYFDFTAKRGTGPELAGSGTYEKPQKISDDFPYGRKGNIGITEIVPSKNDPYKDTYGSMHKKVKNKMLDPKTIRAGLKEFKKRYPKAETVHGDRVTGSTAGSDIEQEFKLPKAAKVFSAAKKLKRRIR